MRIILLPLEPLEERYTAQWYVWFPREFERLGIDYIIVDGERLTERVESGVFLDIHSSYYWEFSQLQKVIKMFKNNEIKDDDIIFSMDIEFPGHFYALKYLALKTNKKVKTYGFLHSGSYVDGEFVSFLEPSMKYFELGWLETLDGIFVGSNYHKQLIIKRRLEPFNRTDLANKIHVTGNPFFINDACELVKPKPLDKREIDIILPGRPDIDKRPWEALMLALTASQRLGRDLNIVVTTGRAKYEGWNSKWIRTFIEYISKKCNVKLYEGLGKKQYYELLSNSKLYITTSISDNFGYCAVEAMCYNVNPIMPNNLSFPEHVNYNNKFLYNNYDEAIEKIMDLYYNPLEVSHYVHKYEKSIEKMVNIMLGE
jgi:hypothetical protein